MFILIMASAAEVKACETCSISRMGRNTPAADSKQWFVEYLFEEQNWHEKEGREGHNLHHAGHHFHNKTTEHFHHLTLGRRLNERLSASLEALYVVRRSVEVDDHSILGMDQRSEGLGDTQLAGEYALLKDENRTLGAVAGIKFPTGSTQEDNSEGARFEPEMQPGSGSYDYLLGGVYRQQQGRLNFIGNLVYVFKNEGSQDFEFGDFLSTTLLCDYVLNPESSTWKTRAGIEGNLQYEQKQENRGASVADSGGTTFLLGPVVTLASGSTELFASFLAPVYQNLGGVHQELDWTWTTGGKLLW